MLSKQRFWNPGSRTPLYESTCQKHISLQPRIWKGRIAALQFLALLQLKTLVLRHFVYNPMLIKQRLWNSGSRTLLYESTCLKHTSLQPRLWKCRISADQFLALFKQETTVVRHFVNYTMLSKQRWWNSGSRTLLYESTCQKHISLQPRFWKGRIAAIQFSALLQQKTLVLWHSVYNPMLTLLQQKTLVLWHFVYNPMLSKQRLWNSGSRSLLYESTRQKHISLQPRFWKGRIDAIQFSALLQQKTLVLWHFVYNPMLCKQRLWNSGSRTLLDESTCQKHISLQPRFWKGGIATIQFSALLQQKTLVLWHFVYNPMLRKQRLWNSGSRTLLDESTCLKHISLQPRFWKCRIAAIQFLALFKQEITVVRYFVNNTMFSKQR
ncbi:hypothetical protein ANTQUA_LOCUS3472 [Anthophora quadrimaculata]